MKKANPRKFDYAKPLKRWRKDWPRTYHQMLHILKEKWPGGHGVQEFVRILMLHEHYTASQIEQAIERALSYGCVHLDGVLYCLHEIASEAEPTDPKPLDLSDRPDLDAFGTVALQMHTRQWIGTYAGRGNGDYQGELASALRAIASYLNLFALTAKAALVRLDGQ